ncbi:MAG TPA: CDP-glucose 4,6-dehydratase [Rhizomicrobium sp.]
MKGGSRKPDSSFWKDKRVLVTGHTGFKGSWASLWLSQLGAAVTGFALAPETRPNMFGLCTVSSGMKSSIGDLRKPDELKTCIDRTQPQIVLHLGAQSLVRQGYALPLETFAINTLGTANLLEALRLAATPEAVLIVTTDKVYANSEDGHAFRENETLGGDDPYSASKAAAEIVTRSYACSFPGSMRVATARGGNVIGGGDFAPDRLVPDVWRAAQAKCPVVLRYPDATRPWQHVLDCLNGYLVFLEDMATDKPPPHALNFGPDEGHALSVRTMVERLQSRLGAEAGWEPQSEAFPKEKQSLQLCSSQARATLGWRNLLDADTAIEWTANWYRALVDGENMAATTAAQILSFSALA